MGANEARDAGPGELRASDADRQAIAERLRVALEEGRIELLEYDERLREAYAAKTYRQLNQLIADLPERSVPGAGVVAPTGSVSPAATADVEAAVQFAGATRRWLVATWDDYAAAVLVCVAVWAAVAVTGGGWAGFWPIWVAGPWGGYLVYATVKGLASGEPRRWAARQARSRLRREERRERRRLERDERHDRGRVRRERRRIGGSGQAGGDAAEI